ncbi:MAG: NnrU family protein [Planctomycetota bacterium]
MRKAAIFLYGLVCYLMFAGVLVYAIAFVCDLVPHSVSSGTEAPLGETLVINTLLLSLFAVQHSGMARRGFKSWIKSYIPEPIERSTYVLATNVVFALLFWQWRPMSATIWQVDAIWASGLLWALCIFGWGFMATATIMIDHFELFGLRQVWRHLHDDSDLSPKFRVVGFYKLVRHPIQTGFVIAFWATPHMTAGHLMFALVTTAYILVALKFFEEPDLEVEFGDQYRDYKRQVGMLVPGGNCYVAPDATKGIDTPMRKRE